MCVIRQTSKTRGHIMNRPTGSLIFLSMVFVIYPPLISKKYVHKQMLPFVMHDLRSIIFSLRLSNENWNAARLLRFVEFPRISPFLKTMGLGHDGSSAP